METGPVDHVCVVHVHVHVHVHLCLLIREHSRVLFIPFRPAALAIYSEGVRNTAVCYGGRGESKKIINNLLVMKKMKICSSSSSQ